MGYHALGSSEIWDRMVNVFIYFFDELIDVHMHVHVCSGSGPMEEEEREAPIFQFSSRGEQKIFKAAWGNRCFSI